jgi:hypothetical protein
MPYLSVDYDPSDFWSECSSREKRELVDFAIEDGLALPMERSSNGFGVAESYTESELLSLIIDLWSNRHFIDIKNVDELRENLRNKKLI